LLILVDPCLKLAFKYDVARNYKTNFAVMI